jgi:hypothetical protein
LLQRQFYICFFFSYSIEELVTTENDYVKDLAILIDKYMESIRQNDIQLPSDFEGGKDKIVFGNIQQIYEWHKTYVNYYFTINP